ncbi:MAG: permease [Candidatus Promineifilaceae bacterium]|nr:permease [Candidatus Promineifilaceae bacterium]
MVTYLHAIVEFILNAFVDVWPYLLLTIPLAVAVQLSGASQYIERAFNARPFLAIVLATLVGAFSPFCSCTVIPVVAALLIGGVPLGPVMSFWIASPAMDPEIFFLSVSMIGWELAIWRLVATLLLSLGAGFVTHYLFARRGWLGGEILRPQQQTGARSIGALLRAAWFWLRQRWETVFQPQLVSADDSARCCVGGSGGAVFVGSAAGGSMPPAGEACLTGQCVVPNSNKISHSDKTNKHQTTFKQQLLQETVAATGMVLKFMALAFLLEALLILFVPQEWVVGLLGPENGLAILTAAGLGVPFYTSNLAALPLMGGLLEQGMQPAAALAFLIAGPTTTLPAMAAVRGLVSDRVFALYVAISLVGAVALGYLYNVVG